MQVLAASCEPVFAMTGKEALLCKKGGPGGVWREWGESSLVAANGWIAKDTDDNVAKSKAY